MKLFNTTVAIIEGNLATFLSNYIRDVRQSIVGEAFNVFTDDTILFALLEYSKFDRVSSEMSESRIEYIVRKCMEFQPVDGRYTFIKDDFNDTYTFVKIVDNSVF